MRDAFGLFYRRQGDVIERAYPSAKDATRPAAFMPVLELSTFVPRNDVDRARLSLWLELPETAA